MDEPLQVPAIATALARAGFELLGGFVADETDGVGNLSDGRAARSVLMVGSVGPAMWAAFEPHRAEMRSDQPLDEWTATTLRPIAVRLGADVRFPFEGPPWLPFQRWASRAGPLSPSPLGLFIHPQHGLWFGLRAALLFAQTLDLPAPAIAPSPCDTCAGQPCLSACPVSAFDGQRYDAVACRSHLERNPDGPCMSRGCLARHACPAGPQARQEPAQARFHMSAFVGSSRT